MTGKASDSLSKHMTNEWAMVPTVGIPYRTPAATFDVPAYPAM